jgi:hypothetical protein
MKIGKLNVSVLLLAAWMFLPAPALRAAEDDQHKENADAPKATSYSDGVKQIQDRMKSIAATIKAGKFKEAHKDAEAVIALSKSLGELALADKSGVPQDKVKEVNRSAKELAEAADSFHDAADDDKAKEANEHYAHMAKLVDALSQYVPKT